MSDTERERQHRRWITFGELIALAALIVSAVGVWISWKSSGTDEKPTRIVEQHQSIPLNLRGKREGDGERLEISPVEPTHALESLAITIPGAASPIEVGSDGVLDSSDVASALKGHDNEPKDRALSVSARIAAHYVEAGKEKTASGTYRLRYMWKGGGLFGGRSLHFLSLSR
ncbi:MAG TPA: hypothetical protein VE820_11170 [Sphingomicrobium sp.]|jgi:hypothetical protein|nr:hypothetical protein [Sphingomicrobium sp.]